MNSTPRPVTILDRIRDSRNDTDRYFNGCLVIYTKNDGSLNIGRIIEIGTAGDGDHFVRLETPQSNWAVPGYRPKPFKVPASRVRADCNFSSAYFNAGYGSAQVSWYCAMNGSRSVVKGVPASDQGNLYTLMDYNHNAVRSSPHPLIMASYVKHQLGITPYPSVEQAVEWMTSEEGSPAIAVHQNLMLSAFYGEDGSVQHFTISSCGLPIAENVSHNHIREAVEDLL